MPSHLDPYSELLPLVAEAEFLSKSLIRGFRTGLGRPSSWEGRNIGRYIERKSGAIKVSGPFPADFVHGHLVEPRTAYLDGTWPIRNRLDDVEALVIVLTMPNWQLIEVTHRNFFHSWARRIDGPVFVSLVNGRGAWASTSWIITATNCARVGSFSGECERYRNAR